jgi:hypothetical protein
MSKNTAKQRVDQFKEWLSWLIATNKKKKYH